MCFRPATIQQDKRCPLCGNSNAIDSRVCGACGTELPDVPALETPSQPGAKMPGAFGESGVAGGGFQPRIPQNPSASGVAAIPVAPSSSQVQNPPDKPTASPKDQTREDDNDESAWKK